MATGDERTASTDRDILVRVDERTKQLMDRFDKFELTAVTKAEFEAKLSPIRMIAFGLVGVLLTGIVVAIMAQVIGK